MKQQCSRRSGVLDARALREQARRVTAASFLATLGVGAAGELASARAEASTAYRELVRGESGLVSYWRAGEPVGLFGARDLMAGNRGTYENGPWMDVPGLVRTNRNTAVEYDGRNDYVRIRDARSLDLESSFALEAWVKPRTLRRHATIIRKGRAYSLKAVRGDVRLTFWDRRGRLRSLRARDQLTTNRNHHIVATYGHGRMRLYVNGRLVKRSRFAVRPWVRADDRPLTIGSYRGHAFHGVIDEVAVYRTRLTRAVVARHYSTAMGRRARSPIRGPEKRAAPAPAPAPAAPAPIGSVLWNGDFEAGNLDQYNLVQEAAPDRITIAASPTRKGSFAAKLTAHEGDLQGGSNPRAQLLSAAQHFPGQEQYIGWSTYFPADLPVIDGFFVFFQFHGKPWSGSPPLGWSVGSDGRIQLNRNQQYGYDRVWSMPLAKGRWVSFVARVNWSKDQTVGFIELWVDGVKQTLSNGQARLYTQTVMDDQNGGLHTIPTNYRAKGSFPGAVTIYHDEVKLGTSYEVVAP